MNIFIDGATGVTGQALMARLQPSVHTVVTIPDHKNIDDRYAAITNADVAVLCLPSIVVNQTMTDLYGVDTTIIDMSSCNRISSDWTYGYFDDIINGTVNVANTNRISNPGCFATGIQTILRPIRHNLTQAPIVITGTAGYTTAGLTAPSEIAYKMTNVDRQHTHVQEIRMRSSIINDIIFLPAMGSFAEGQLISIPLTNRQYISSLDSIYLTLAKYYRNHPIVKVLQTPPSSIVLGNCVVPNTIQLAIAEFEEHVVVHAWYSNLDIGSVGNIHRIINAISQQATVL